MDRAPRLPKCQRPGRSNTQYDAEDPGGDLKLIEQLVNLASLPKRNVAKNTEFSI
jgi:hypothetical protein